MTPGRHQRVSPPPRPQPPPGNPGRALRAGPRTFSGARPSPAPALPLLPAGSFGRPAGCVNRTARLRGAGGARPGSPLRFERGLPPRPRPAPRPPRPGKRSLGCACVRGEGRRERGWPGSMTAIAGQVAEPGAGAAQGRGVKGLARRARSAKGFGRGSGRGPEGIERGSGGGLGGGLEGAGGVRRAPLPAPGCQLAESRTAVGKRCLLPGSTRALPAHGTPPPQLLSASRWSPQRGRVGSEEQSLLFKRRCAGA